MQTQSSTGCASYRSEAVRPAFPQARRRLPVEVRPFPAERNRNCHRRGNTLAAGLTCFRFYILRRRLTSRRSGGRYPRAKHWEWLSGGWGVGVGEGGGGAGGWPPHLRRRPLLDLGKHQRRLIFKRRFHGFKITLGIFPGTILKTQVAQVVIDVVATLQQLIELCPARRKIRGIRLNVENEEDRGNRKGQARADHGPIRGSNQKCNECRKKLHKSVLRLTSHLRPGPLQQLRRNLPRSLR